METLAALSSLFAAFGLSSAAGLNAYIPLLTIGTLQRLGYLTLSEPYTVLGSTPALVILGALALIDFIGDKVPVVDHVLHIIGGVVHPVAGAIAFASQSGAVSALHPALALALGVVLAGGFHTARAAVRPAATATTAGLGNPVVSLIEDLTALVLSLLAILAPLIAIALVAALLLLIVGVWRSWRRVLRR